MREVKTTHQHLVWELTKRNKDGKYERIITKAIRMDYHDFKSQTGDDKTGLVNDLSEFPELGDIRNDVMSGVYDESPDEADKEELRGWLKADGASEEFMKIFGL